MPPKPGLKAVSSSAAGDRTDAARWTAFLEALEELPSDALLPLVAKAASENIHGQSQKLLRTIRAPGDLVSAGTALLTKDLLTQRLVINDLTAAATTVIRDRPAPKGLETAAEELLAHAKNPEMRVAGAAILGAVDSEAAVDALVQALSVKGGVVLKAGHRSPVREQAAKSLASHPNEAVGPRVLALLTPQKLEISKKASLATFGKSALEDQVSFLTEALSILRKRRHEPSLPLLWRLAHARHESVSDAARHALLMVIDDKTLKSIFGMTRKAFLAKHETWATIAPLTVNTLFKKAAPTLKRLWGPPR